MYGIQSVQSLLLIHCIQSEEIADTLRSFAQLDSRKPLVAILDPTEQKVYTLPESITDVTRSIVDELIDEFKQAALDYDPLLALSDGSDFEKELNQFDQQDLVLFCVHPGVYSVI